MKERVISAVGMIAIVMVSVFSSFVSRVLLFAVAGILCSYEFSRNMEKMNVYCAAWVMYVYITFQAVLALFHAGAVSYIACFTGGIYLAMFSGIVHKKVSGTGAIYTVCGLAYPGVIFGVMMMISASPIWKETLVLGALSCWACDAFALFGGLRFGKHKLAPAVSPNKSVEGSVCGAAASAVAGFLIWLLKLLPGIPLHVCVITALISSTLGQIGDLAESLLKRMIGTKDFSNLIPGHGGVFDRVDSLMFAIPTAYLCLFIAGFRV